MKKYAIAIIGLVLAALVFGSCGNAKTGGAIVVTNKTTVAGSPVDITVKIANLFSPETPIYIRTVKAADGVETFLLDEDGMYIVSAYAGTTATEPPFKTEQKTLSGGEKVSLTFDLASP
jgi:hypothetical protein